MKHICICAMLFLFLATSFGQYTWNATTIKMDARFDKSIEISSIIYQQGTIYLASPRCDSIYIGKINNKNSFKVSSVKPLGSCDYEGAAYYKGKYYFSDDDANTIFKYSPAFGSTPTQYPIKLNTLEGARSNNGFEGLAMINDTTFYILLEKDISHHYSTLYKGLLRNDSIEIVDVKQIRVKNGDRYCDLFYNRTNNTLFLLKTKRTKYVIDSLKLDKRYNIGGSKDALISPALVFDFSVFVNAKEKENYNTNVEGIAMSDQNTFYIISDNCNAISCGCGTKGQNKKTLFMRLKRRLVKPT